MAQKSCQFALSPSISAKFYIGLRRSQPTVIYSQVCCVGFPKRDRSFGKYALRMHYAQASTPHKARLSANTQAILTILQESLMLIKQQRQ